MANRDIRITLRDRQVSGGALPSNALMGEPFINLFDGVLKFSGVTGGGFEPSSTSSVFEVGSTLYNQRISNRLNINDNFIISGDTGFISTYGGITGAGLAGKFLSGTTSGFVVADISDIATSIDSYTTGATWSPNTLTISLNNGKPNVNVVIDSFNNLTASTLYSGSTNVGTLFVNTISNGTNTTIGGSANHRTVNLVDSPSINNLTFSGTAIGGDLYATNVSGGTLYSGSTNLEQIIKSLSGTSGDLWSSSTGSNSIIANNGTGNLASGDYSLVAGYGNSATTLYSSIAGGQNNLVSGDKSFIGAGQGNSLSSAHSAIVTGLQNIISGGQYSSIVGGYKNTLTGSYSFIGGGIYNVSSANKTFIGAGGSNSATTLYASVVGGQANLASGNKSFVGNGQNNISSGLASFVGAGTNNLASGDRSAIVGGRGNLASSNNAFVGGGYENSATTSYSSIIGGYQSLASGAISIAGGYQNIASGNYSVSLGGRYNLASNTQSGAFAGLSNTASGIQSVSLGGRSNIASGDRSFVSGYFNSATTMDAVVIGGRQSLASGYASSIIGARDSVSSGNYSFIGGGSYNSATSQNSSVIAGSGNTVSGQRSVVLGGQSIIGSANDTVYMPNARLAETPGSIIYSAGTDLYDIFLTTADGNDVTRVQPGTNITTGGTANNPTVNLVDSPSVNNLTFSGTAFGGNVAASSISASTLTNTRVVFAGAGGLLTDDSNLTFNSGTDVLTIGGAGNLTTNGTQYSGGTIVDDGIFTIDATTRVEIDSDLLPTTNLTYNLGSNSNRWNNIYTKDLNASGAITTTGITISGLLAGSVVYAGSGGELKTEAGFTYDENANTFNTSKITVGIPGQTGTTATIYGDVLVIGESISGFTSQLYIEDNLIELNYNPTADTSSTSLGAGWSIQDGSGVAGTDVFLDIRGTSTGLANRSFATNLEDIRIRETGTISSPNGVRVLAEQDVLDGGSY